MKNALVVGHTDSEGLFLSSDEEMFQDVKNHPEIYIDNMEDYEVKVALSSFERCIKGRVFTNAEFYVFPSGVTLDDINGLLKKHGASII